MGFLDGRIKVKYIFNVRALWLLSSLTGICIYVTINAAHFPWNLIALQEPAFVVRCAFGWLLGIDGDA